MVFNNTKVIQARLRFQRLSGASIEVFCLDPVQPQDYAQMFSVQHACVWTCIVGNLKKWKEAELVMAFEYRGQKDELRAIRLESDIQSVKVRFEWTSDLCFAQVLEACGAIPIPPYLHRDSEALDEERYQTVYSSCLGSVAAPTAGLHFTDEVLADIRSRNIDIEELTLHVGAGTFKPVKSETIDQHAMHAETFRVERRFLERLRAQLASGKPIVAVGTTSVRTLESLYWIGARLHTEKKMQANVAQWTPYDHDTELPVEQALSVLLEYMRKHEMEILDASTQIMIAPSYTFRIVTQLVTNFHQPQSTLLLLISALIGKQWKSVYDYALQNDFRFLSYGDSSLLIP